MLIFVPYLYLKKRGTKLITNNLFFCNLLQHIATCSNTWLHKATKMSSNIRIQRICQHCEKEFKAKTTVTKYCSDDCAKRAYKARKKDEKVTASDKETRSIISRPIEELKIKDFLTITEACKILSVSRWTIWRAIKRNELIAGKIGRRTIIRRADLEKIFVN